MKKLESLVSKFNQENTKFSLKITMDKEAVNILDKQSKKLLGMIEYDLFIYEPVALHTNDLKDFTKIANTIKDM